MRARVFLPLLIFGVSLGSFSVFAEDPDFDGFSTEIELVLGTDPQDSASRPTLADNQYKILAWWPLMENVDEALGTSLDGILKNGARFKQNSLILDGKDDYINFGNAESLNITSNISYCLWLKPEGSWGTQRIIGKFQAKGNERSFATFTGNGARIWTFISEDGSLHGGEILIQATGRHAYEKNQWQHLAITWDATNDCHGLSTYVDGLSMQMYGMPSSTVDSIHAGEADLTLGTFDIRMLKHKWKEKELIQNAFKGRMSQLLLCDGILSQLEVQEIYLLGRNTDLLGYINTDYDQDLMLDWWERLYFNDISQGAQDDFDSDGLVNIDELTHETIPTNYDTDADQLSDGQEVHTYHTDPLDQDSDNDGTMDGAEVLGGTDPTNELSYLADISGAIIYSGGQLGPIKTLAAQNQSVWVSTFYANISSPGAYSINEIPNLTNYWLRAYCDSNRNGLNDLWEAQGSFISNPLYLQADRAGVDVSLVDPDVDNDLMPDWWEITFLGSISANPLVDEDEDNVSNIQEYHDGTNPQDPDTDKDGWKDSDDREVSVSRAFIEWGEPQFTHGDEYVYYPVPEWLKKAYKTGGEWIISEPPTDPLLLSSYQQMATAPLTMSVSTIDQPAEVIPPPPTDIDWDKPDLSDNKENIYLEEEILVRTFEEDGKWMAQPFDAPLSMVQQKYLIKKNPLLMPCLEKYKKNSKLKTHYETPFNPAEWHVPATEPDGVGSLNVEIDRTIVTGNLQMTIKLFEHPGGTLYIDLLTTSGTPVASDLYGNIIADSNQIVDKSYTVPLGSYPTATIIKLRRGTGEISVGEMLLFIDQDGDGLDAGQEAILGTIDLPVVGLDSDNDGVNDNVEVNQGTDPADSTSFRTDVSGTISYSGPETGDVYIVINTTSEYVPIEHSASISVPGAYTVSGVPTLTNYYISGWRDFNGNHSPDAWEPQGNYAGNPYYVAGHPAGINITLTDAQDTDGDGLADVWEQKYFSSPTSAAPTDDPDNDTLNNLDEYYMGTDPTKEDSNGDGVNDAGRYAKIKLLPLEVTAAGIKLKTGYPEGFTNRLDIFTSTDLNNKTGWKLEATVNVSGATNIVNWLQSSPSDRIFFKVFNADYDQDSDGLADGRERLIYGTDVLDDDSDDDTISDGDEISLTGTNPNNQDSDGDSYNDNLDAFPLDVAAWLDTDNDGMPDELNGASTSQPPLVEDEDDDNDGLPDIWESANSLDPKDSTGVNGSNGDPDGDTLTNLQEYESGTNPRNGDPDGDGLNDYYEIHVYKTDPADPDSDDDQLNDYKEAVILKSDPLAPGVNISQVYGESYAIPQYYAEPSTDVYYGHEHINDTEFVYGDIFLYDDVFLGKGWVKSEPVPNPETGNPSTVEYFVPDLRENPSAVYFGQPDYIDCPDTFVYGLRSTMHNDVNKGVGWVYRDGVVADFSQASTRIYYGKPDYSNHKSLFVYSSTATMWKKVDMGIGWLSRDGFVPDLSQPAESIYYSQPDNIDCEGFWVYSHNFNVGGWYNIGRGWLLANSPASYIPDLTEPSGSVYYGRPPQTTASSLDNSEEFIWSYSISMEDDASIGTGWATPQGMMADLSLTKAPIYRGRISGTEEYVFAKSSLGLTGAVLVDWGWINMNDYIADDEPSPDSDGDGKVDGYDPYGQEKPAILDDNRIVNMKLTVGDDSDSHTEAYSLHAGEYYCTMPNPTLKDYLASKTVPLERGLSYKNSYIEALGDSDPDGDYYAMVSGENVYLDDPNSYLGSKPDTGFNSGYRYFDVYLPLVESVVYRPGTMSSPGAGVSRYHEGKVYVTVNDDNDEGHADGTVDKDDEIIGATDDDIIKLVLKGFKPSDLDKGTLELTVTPAGSLRLFESSTDVLALAFDAVSGDRDKVTMDLASPLSSDLWPYLPGNDKTIYAEALTPGVATLEFAYRTTGGKVISSDKIVFRIIKAEFIRQDNSVIPSSGDDACHMVSKFLTSRDLPAEMSFNATGTDHDTFRVQVVGLAEGMAPTVDVKVVPSGGGEVHSLLDIAMEHGTVDGVSAYRSKVPIRLVSNFIDDNMYNSSQTLRANLGDRVEADIKVDGKEISSIELSVGRPITESEKKAARKVKCRFVIVDHADVALLADVDGVIDSMNKAWAQASVYFVKESAVIKTPVRNILEIVGQAAGPAQFSIKVDGQQVGPINIGNSGRISAIKVAEDISAGINSTLGAGTASAFHHNANGNWSYVVVKKGQNVLFDELVNTDPDITINHSDFIATDDTVYNYPEMPCLAANYGDSDPSSMDIFIVKALSGASGAAWITSSLGSESNMRNTYFLSLTSAYDFGDYPHVAPHEAAHLILDSGHYSGVDAEYNLLTPTTVTTIYDTIDGHKRLTEGQHTRSRTVNDGVLLQQ